MLAAIPYWDNPRSKLAKVLSPFGREDVNVFLRYLNLFLDTVFPTPLPNFKSLAHTSFSINSGQPPPPKTIAI